MGTRDPRVDAYIADAADFARPILEHLREVVHGACPQVEEDIKWGMPFFVYEGPMCNMAAFKAHCAFGFWKGAGIVGDDADDSAMGHLGRITSLDDLPPKKVLTGYVKQAVALKDAQAKAPSRPKKKKAKPEAEVPADLAAALAKNDKAKATFEGFSPSHRREYIEWITGAKREATRARRLATAIAWMEEGKSQNWKYER